MVFGDRLPGGFLLQPGNTGHVEHHSEEEQWLIAKLVQLLLEGFLQLHPAMGRGLGLSLEPQPEVMGLEPGGGETEGGGQCGANGHGMAMTEKEKGQEGKEKGEGRWDEEEAKKG